MLFFLESLAIDVNEINYNFFIGSTYIHVRACFGRVAMWPFCPLQNNSATLQLIQVPSQKEEIGLPEHKFGAHAVASHGTGLQFSAQSKRRCHLNKLQKNQQVNTRSKSTHGCMHAGPVAPRSVAWLQHAANAGCSWRQNTPQFQSPSWGARIAFDLKERRFFRGSPRDSRWDNLSMSFSNSSG
jgi:hypothetical protein